MLNWLRKYLRAMLFPFAPESPPTADSASVYKLTEKQYVFVRKFTADAAKVFGKTPTGFMISPTIFRAVLRAPDRDHIYEIRFDKPQFREARRK